MSGKFRSTSSNSSSANGNFNDTSLTLFGYNSVVGRSVIVQNKQERVACSTIKRAYSVTNGREVTAIASFHHPNGFVYGYVRLSQLVGFDESESETLIEINLRYPGAYNKNFSQDHFWQIFVNPVGVDATVKEPLTR